MLGAPVNDDESKLLLRVHKGEDSAARELWSRHGRAMLTYARAITSSGADDVVQRALCRILDLRRDQLAGVRDVGAFLATLVRREGLNWIRGEGRERVRRSERGRAAAGAMRSTVASFAGGDAGERSSDARLIAKAVDSLPRRWREVVVLRHVVGLTFDQLALALSANRSTVASRYREAVARLRMQLGQRLGGRQRHGADEEGRDAGEAAQESTGVGYARL